MFERLHTTRAVLPKLCPASYSLNGHILSENHTCLNSPLENHDVQQHVTVSQEILE